MGFTKDKFERQESEISENLESCDKNLDKSEGLLKDVLKDISTMKKKSSTFKNSSNMVSKKLSELCEYIGHLKSEKRATVEELKLWEEIVDKIKLDLSSCYISYKNNKRLIEKYAKDLQKLKAEQENLENSGDCMRDLFDDSEDKSNSKILNDLENKSDDLEEGSEEFLDDCSKINNRIENSYFTQTELLNELNIHGDRITKVHNCLKKWILDNKNNKFSASACEKAIFPKRKSLRPKLKRRTPE